MDRQLAKLRIGPAPSHFNQFHHRSHARRLARKPRHQNQQIMMFPVDMRRMKSLIPRQTQALTRTNSNLHGQILQLHNYYRARHCAPPLVISERLNQIAQSYAEHLAATSTFEHSGNKLGDESLGENLYMRWISQGPIKVDAKIAVKSWYDEVAMHNFKNPKFSEATGHFTQLVWKNTRKLGIGIAVSPDGQEYYIVTNYYPAGNISDRKSFMENVLPANCRQ